MSLSEVPTYRQTLEKIESLILFKIPPSERPTDVRQKHNVEAMQDYVRRLELDISPLSIIHVAGTKGKGSTCTFCESVLRARGFRTGLYTSPHLIDIRERIKVNGEPISKSDFTRTFWNVHNTLERTPSALFPSMATYFRILTCMALQIFLEQKVDVAILEVGIGGRLDATNIVMPEVCGITSIGYDHVAILGDTLELIAGEKAGIIKDGKPVVTYEQKGGVLGVFEEHANRHSSPLLMAPTFDEYLEAQTPAVRDSVSLQMLGQHQKRNASLALTLCDVWEKSREGLVMQPEYEDDRIVPLQADPFAFSTEHVVGVNSCRFEGRGHVVRFPDHRLSFFLDGAHTNESIRLCNEWFHEMIHPGVEGPDGWVMEIGACPKNINGTLFERLRTVPNVGLTPEEEKGEIEVEGDQQAEEESSETPSSKPVNILVFNYTGGRDPRFLLRPFMPNLRTFDFVVFVPLDSSKELLTKVVAMTEKDRKQLVGLMAAWKELVAQELEGSEEPAPDADSVKMFESLNDCLVWLWSKSRTEDVSVLVTGSLYLVGDMLLKLTKIHMNEE